MSDKNTKETCAQSLRRRVLTMELEPGSSLDEIQLAREFGLSRTPLREIVQRLSGEGYFILEKNRGAKVASLDIATLNNFFQAAPMIYASLSRLAAERATAPGVRRLKEIQQAYRKSISNDEPTQTAMLNHEFHRSIGEMADISYLMASLERLLIDHARISIMFYRPATLEDRKRVETAADQHDRMIETFEKRSPADAVDVTLQHWDLSRNSLERFVRSDPLPFSLGRAAHAV